MNTSDKTIIDLFWSRSESAIPALSEKYGRIAGRVAMNILGDPRDSEECLDDGYMGMWNSLPPNRPDSLCAYFVAMVRNLALRLYRYKHAVKRSAIMCELDDLITGSAVTDADSRAITAVLNKFLASLDRGSRLLFTRRYYLGMSIPEAADGLGITENNASVRLSRLRAKLKKMLESEGINV